MTPPADDDVLERFKQIIWADDLVRDALLHARDLGAPDWRIVSGALYNAVWNHLTGRPPGYGVRDVDLLYFDDRDLSYAAEDAVIRRARPLFDGLAAPVEIRNQARAHLWVGARYGIDYPPLPDTDAALTRFTTIAHAVGARLTDEGALDVIAPFGLSDIFALRLRPNPHCDPRNRASYDAKAARARATWPGVTVEPWPTRRDG